MSLSISQLSKNKVAYESSLLSDNLYLFVKAAWPIIEPATEFVDNWHIKAICKYLKACEKGDIRNLIINIPPRCMKSRIVNVFFPAWIWTRKPSAKFLALSATDELAKNASRDCQRLIRSEWYQSRWPIQLIKQQEARFDNSETGQFLSFGVKSSFTGEGADFILMDDLISATNSLSDTELEKVNEIYDNSVVSRLNDPKQGVKILIMQRLSTGDLVGHLLEKEKDNWEQLILPMRYEGIRFVSSIGFTDPRKEAGELLWNERFGEAEVANLEKSLGELGAACQLQQRPSPVTGSIYKKDWFSNRVDNTNIVARFISWDTASATGDNAAYTAGIVGEITSDYRLFIREVYREKLAFPQLSKAIEDLAKKYKHKLIGIVIENKSTGTPVIQTLEQGVESWIKPLLVPFNPKGDKEARASIASLWAEKGCILLPPPNENFPWLFDFEDELFNFPNSKKKDQVDALDQLILYCENYLSEGFKFRRQKINDQ